MVGPMNLPPIHAQIAPEVASLTAKAGHQGSASQTEPFGDLLAAMLRGGDGGGFLGARPDTPETQEQAAAMPVAQLAEMFNEHGLFLGAISPAATVTTAEADLQLEELHRSATRSAGAEVSVRLHQQGAHEVPPSSHLQRPSFEPASPGRVALPGSAPVTGDRNAAGGSGGAAQLKQVAGAVAPARPVMAGPVLQPLQDAPANEAGAPAKRRAQPLPARLVQNLLEAGGRTNTQLIVQAAEGGISLSARIDKLSRDERERLRDEIIELLGRHGFAAGEIRLNGQSGRTQIV